MFGIPDGEAENALDEAGRKSKSQQVFVLA